MRIWLVTIGEPLPSDGNSERLLRTGMLAETLAGRGHEIVWWTSTFDHARKRQRFDNDAMEQLAPHYFIRLLHGRPYPRNICLRRWVNHRSIARRFAALAPTVEQPDLILSSLPTVELCGAAIAYAQPRGIPVAIDVRDLWPEIFVDLAPRFLQGATTLALSPLFGELRAVCRKAQAVVGTTREYVDYALSHAQRFPSYWDRPFPLGYRTGQHSETALHAADSFWNELGIQPTARELTCCFFGTMGRHCTLETVLHAARAVEQSGSRMRFVLCGTGDKLAGYRAMSQGCKSIFFPGWVDGAQIRTLMERSSVGLAPYVSNTNYRNNIPNKPIEYLSAGLPIVSSLEGVLERLIREHHCGLTYAGENVKQLTNDLLHLEQQPSLVREMSASARTLFDRQFDANLVYGQMADHLERLAPRRLTQEAGSKRTSYPALLAVS